MRKLLLTLAMCLCPVIAVAATTVHITDQLGTGQANTRENAILAALRDERNNLQKMCDVNHPQAYTTNVNVYITSVDGTPDGDLWSAGAAGDADCVTP